MKTYLTHKEACQYLGVGEKFLRTHRGEGPGLVMFAFFANAYHYKVQWLDQWAEQFRCGVDLDRAIG